MHSGKKHGPTRAQTRPLPPAPPRAHLHRLDALRLRVALEQRPKRVARRRLRVGDGVGERGGRDGAARAARLGGAQARVDVVDRRAAAGQAVKVGPHERLQLAAALAEAALERLEARREVGRRRAAVERREVRRGVEARRRWRR